MQNSQYFLNEAAAAPIHMQIPQYFPIETCITPIHHDDVGKKVDDAIDEFTEGGRKVNHILAIMRRLKAKLDFSSQFDEQGQMMKNPRKLTYGQIFGESDEVPSTEGIFNPPVVYNGYQMTFLKEHQGLLLPDPVLLQKVKYGFLISMLSEDNLLVVKDGLSHINVEMQPKIQSDRAFFIRGVDFNWYDVYGKPCAPTFGGPVKVKISIQGYKLKDGIRNPIWKLLDVFNC